MLRKGLLAGAGLALLASCGSVPDPVTGLTGGPVFEIPVSCTAPTGTVTNMICAGKDLWSMIAEKPAPLASFEYSETDAFDMQLSSSMRANISKITVENPSLPLPLETTRAQQFPAADSSRMVFWLTQISKTGGEIKACEIALESSLTDWLIQMATKYVGQRLTYGPADKYNATVFFDSQTDGSPIRRVVFSKRDGNALSCG